MASVSIPVAVTLIAAAGTAYESHEQGEATQAADTRKARVEADNEEQKQIGMRQNMLKALASQNAEAGVGGVGLSKANTMRQITQAQNDLMISQSNSSAQVSLLDQAGANAVAAGNVGAGVDIAKGIGNAYSISGGSSAQPTGPSGSGWS